jgi:hypothetical protein
MDWMPVLAAPAIDAPDAPDGWLVAPPDFGEWSAGYLFNVWVPATLARLCPDAKILVSIRDPVERLRSALAREHRRQIAAPGREGMRPPQFDLEFYRGLFGLHLRRLFDQFPGDILVLQYERCVADPVGELRRTYEFLGVDDVDHVPESLDAHPNRGIHQGGFEPGLYRQIVASYRDDVRALVDLGPPGFDVRLWTHFADLA